MTKYRAREITKVLIDSLESMPVVALSGMRQTGKSTLLLNQPQLRKRKYLNFDDFNVLEAARRNPEELISGEQPVTIDEAQKCPEIFTVIKKHVDRCRVPGKFLLSGSANFLLLKTISESLAGRAVYLTLYPFTRREIQGKTKSISALAYFMNKNRFPEHNIPPVSWEEIIKGGMPSICLGEVKKPNIWFHGFEQTYLERDIRDLSQVGDLVSFRNLLQLVAFRNTQVLKQSELARDAKLNVMTTSRYLSLMESSFILNRMPPYLKNPSTRLIKSPKIYLSDTGLAAHLFGVKNIKFNESLRGVFLESYVAQNLMSILSSSYPEARMAYWHVQGRYEVDFIIEINQETVAIEIKNSTRWEERDLAGIKAYLKNARNCKTCILAYRGKEILKLEDKIWLVPIHVLID